MSNETVNKAFKSVKLTTAMLSAVAASTVGTMAPGAGFAAGIATYYLASPQPAVCDGSCAFAPSFICGLNGVNYYDYQYC